MNDAHRDEIAKLESLYAMNPEGRVFTHLAEACRKAGQMERARQILEDGLQRHPDYASAHVVLGRVLADCGEDGDAAAEFRRVLELDRHNLVALRSLGELASRSGRIDEALHYYGELAVLDPTDPVLQDEVKSLEERRTRGGGQGEGAPTDGLGGEPEPEAEAASGPEASAEDEAAEADTLAEVSFTQVFAAAGLGLEGTAERERDGGSEGDGMETGDDATADGAAEGEPEAGEEDADREGGPAELAALEVDVDMDAGRPIDIGDFASFEVEPGGAGWSLTGDESPAEVLEAEFAIEDTTVESLEIEMVAGLETSDDSAEATVAEESWASAPDHGDLILDDETDGSTFDGEEIQATEGAEFTLNPVEESSSEAVPVEGEAAPGEPDGTGSGSGEDESPQTIEGRWQAPTPNPADDQAERSSPPADTGEWIPAERWEWVAASADTSGSVAPGSSDEAGSDGPEPDLPDTERLASVDADAGAAEFDAETSFAGLNAERVDSFEAGAAAVLEAFGGGGDEFEPEVELEAVSAEEGDLAYELSLETAESVETPASWIEDESAGTADEVELEAVAEPSDWPAGASWTTGADDDSGDQVITETLAEIYASQGLYDRAAAVYRRLVAQNPGNERLAARLADLETATDWTEPGAADAAEETEAFLSRVESAWTGGEGAAGAGDSPYAWSADAAATESDSGARVGDYFSALLAWRPSQALPSMETAGSAAAEADAGAWFSGGEREAGVEDAGGVGREGDEDLEMFRSWLKSLKK